MSDDRPPDPLPSDLAAAGAAMREEWRVEQEAVVHDAAEQWQHSRGLLDLARDHMHRGDRVAITVAGHRAVGEIVEVARDRIALLDPAGGGAARVDVQVADSIPLLFAVVERARAGGRSSARTSTFRARLLELEQAGAPVIVRTTSSRDSLTGIVSVGADYVAIAAAGGTETVVALAAVASVAPAG